jgi:ankyrin repeat protein
MKVKLMTKPELIDEYDELGMTQLLSAVFIGDPATVKALLQRGANPNKPQGDHPSATPLWHAEEDFGLFEVARVLRARGAR